MNLNSHRWCLKRKKGTQKQGNQNAVLLAVPEKKHGSECDLAIFRAPKSSPPALIPPFRYSITPTLAALSHKSLVKACDLSWGCQAVEKGRRASAFLKEVKGWIPVLGRYIAGLSVFLSVCLSIYLSIIYLSVFSEEGQGMDSCAW